MRPIVTYPNAVLRTVCRTVPNLHEPTVVSCIKDLVASASKESCLGVAANQLGYDWRMFVMMTPVALRSSPPPGLEDPSTFQDKFFVVVNPKYVKRSKALVLGVEGCLSLPDQSALVRRHAKIDVRFTTVTGKTCDLSLTGLPAVVFQHEYDHLDGLLQTDKELVRQPGSNAYDEMKDDAFDRYYAQAKKYFGL